MTNNTKKIIKPRRTYKTPETVVYARLQLLLVIFPIIILFGVMIFLAKFEIGGSRTEFIIFNWAGIIAGFLMGLRGLVVILSKETYGQLNLKGMPAIISGGLVMLFCWGLSLGLLWELLFD